MGSGAATGDDNIVVGYQAGYSLTSGHSSIFIGKDAGKLSTGNHNNIAIGSAALDAADGDELEAGQGEAVTCLIKFALIVRSGGDQKEGNNQNE